MAKMIYYTEGNLATNIDRLSDVSDNENTLSPSLEEFEKLLKDYISGYKAYIESSK